MNVIEEIKNDISGLEALRDWLGDDGLPVAPIVAEFRSQRCVSGNNGEPCPMNVAPNWWDNVKSVIADWIKAELEIKNRMELRVDAEDSLHICKACGCCLRLKVWAPAKHLKDHISLKQIETTPNWCWMRRELT